jgi:hypothetical protein
MPSGVDDFAVRLEEAHLLAVGQRLMPTRSAFLAPAFQIATLDNGIGISFSMMPPGWLACGFGFVCA